MVIKKVNKLVAFDFDDTLVETSSLIGARFTSKSHQFEDFVFENNIQFSHFEKGFWWLDSANYALLEDCGLPSGAHLEFDYAQTMSIDLNTINTIDPMLKLMRESIEAKDTLTLLVTARGGDTKVFSPSLGTNVTSSNRKQISEFLKRADVAIPDKHLHTVGDLMDDTSVAKAIVMAEYAREYSPDEIIFYDDSVRNLRSVGSLLSKEFPSIKTKMVRVTAGRLAEFNNYRKTGLKERFREILSCIPE